MIVKTLVAATGFVVGSVISLMAIAQQQPQQEQAQQQQAQQAQQQNGKTNQDVQGAAGQTSGKQQQQKASAQGELPPTHPPVLMLVPVQVYTQASKEGCWVRLYEGKNFQGDFLTVLGPAELPRLERNISIVGFDSASVGPKARVVAYDEENFQDRSATMNPGQQIADLNDQKLGMFEDIESMRVTCG
jgi:hypothetical protein